MVRENSAATAGFRASCSLWLQLPMERTLIIVPAHNEAGRVGVVVGEVRHALPEADVLVVDDGSSDSTAGEATAAGARVLALPVNLGYGAALQAGYKVAIRDGFPVVGQIDADGQHAAEYLPSMLEQLRETDAHVVIGSRFLDRDGHYRPSNARKLGIALFA